jgi:hypothetical protein
VLLLLLLLEEPIEPEPDDPVLPLVADEPCEPAVELELPLPVPLVPRLELLLSIDERSVSDRPVAALNSLIEMRPSLSTSSVLNWLARSKEPVPDVDEPV